MEIVVPILTIATDLFDSTATWASHVRGLRENIECLRGELNLLIRRSQDVERRVRDAPERWMRPANEVLGWLKDVRTEQVQVHAVLREGDALLEKKWLGRCRNIRSIYKLGKRVTLKIRRVNELTTGGNFNVVAYEATRAVVDELPLGETVGLHTGGISLYRKVCRCLHNYEGGIVGLYGRSGVGKTTLMTKINNDLLGTDHRFDTVIWIWLSKESSEEDAQQVIGNKLRIIDSIWHNRSQKEKATEIFNILKTKRFLLILDNVCSPLDLLAIGVPPPHIRKRSKVIITSRLLRTCILMKSNSCFEVKPLAGEYAWSLFINHLSMDARLLAVYNPRIKILAKNIVAKCQGLPSAIIKAAQESAGFKTHTEWQQSIQNLEDLINEEISSGKDDRLCPEVEDDGMPVGSTVGLDSLYERVCQCLTEFEGGIIGLYGTGGVGKTTLMKKIYNEFSKRRYPFDTVIWVSLSEVENAQAAEEVIRTKLQIPTDSMWQSRTDEGRSGENFKIMKAKRGISQRVLLLLDDVWHFSLLDSTFEAIFLSRKSVIITTRSQKICDDLKVPRGRQFKVEFLAQEEARALFLEKVGKKTLDSHPEIPELAGKVVERCKGLPLALVTLGQAMANKNFPEEWEQAIQDLEKLPTEITGMEDDLYHVLKLSYDHLKDDITKSCFIYFSFFPRGYEIRNDELIEHWIGQGFIGSDEKIHEARRKGHKIIENLKNACLFEEGDEFKECIKMHEVIHDMALWISQECGKMRKEILVYKSLDLADAQRTSWNKAKTILLWGNNIKELPKTPDCSDLETLFVRECIQLKTFPKEFFKFMPHLRVLDLSATHCLTELPDDIDRLAHLEYINISMTGIRELPIGLKKLQRLRCFILDGMLPLVIHPHVISGLLSLQLFSMFDGNTLSRHRVTLVEELESIKSLNEISLSFRSVVALNRLLTSPELQRCMKRLGICDCEDLSVLVLSSVFLNYLEALVISNCHALEEMKVNVEKEQNGELKQSYDPPNLNLIVKNNQHFDRLHVVKFWRCPKLLNLTWLIYATHLQSLDIQNCKSMREVIGDEFITSSMQNANVFTRLRYLVVGGMKMLESLYHGTLLFPLLEAISVINCPRLGRLPFDPKVVPNSLKKIDGDLTWWDSLNWDEACMEHAYVVYFSPQYLADPVSEEEKRKKKPVIEVSTSSTTT